MKTEEKYMGQLLNIERTVYSTDQELGNLTDSEVYEAYQTLLVYFKNKELGSEGNLKTLTGNAEHLKIRLLHAIEQFTELEKSLNIDVKALLSKPTFTKSAKKIKVETPYTDCFTRLISSVKLWTEQDPRRGYLNFMGNFLKDLK